MAKRNLADALVAKGAGNGGGPRRRWRSPPRSLITVRRNKLINQPCGPSCPAVSASWHMGDHQRGLVLFAATASPAVWHWSMVFLEPTFGLA